ncbi:GNAT family N-acetyltransferase [Moritella sp. 36]|uniref:GNAT family N-acetyltransferase n=1 Tax=Moritella sp. 36 TaxID=2746233 RepID=UPI001BAC65ED|nr:GNAT family N-acetyltransferase [Moritella sp. 36]QUM89377.1 GNAT family N-acetyltransferase [Moritella sp. 36]
MIRKATQSDCINLAVLSLQVWLHTYATQGIRTKLSHYALSTFTEQYFNNMLDDSTCNIWVYTKDEHLVGFIVVDLASTFGCAMNGYEVKTLYVSEHFHGQGIGRKLLDKIKVQHGYPFWLSTWVKNESALRFYRHLDFTTIGELNFDIDGELHENHVLSYF